MSARWLRPRQQSLRRRTLIQMTLRSRFSFADSLAGHAARASSERGHFEIAVRLIHKDQKAAEPYDKPMVTPATIQTLAR